MDRKEYLETLGRVIDAKDSKGFASYITENGIFKFGNNEPVVGREAIRDYVANFFSVIKSSEHKVINFWEQNNTVIWQGEVAYTRLDDKKVTVCFVNIFSMQDELIKEYLIYIDNSPLFQA